MKEQINNKIEEELNAAKIDNELKSKLKSKVTGGNLLLVSLAENSEMDKKEKAQQKAKERTKENSQCF